MRRYKEAATTLERAIRVEPESPAAHFNLGVVQLRSGNKRAALEQYQTLERNNTELADQLYRQIYRNRLLVVRGD
jgi:tetratricopeptide (TPR) repeat protein